MTFVIVALVALTGVIVIGGGGTLWYLNDQKKRSERDDRFRVAIMRRRIRLDAAKSNKEDPEAYIAAREIREIQQRYTEGKENPE